MPGHLEQLKQEWQRDAGALGADSVQAASIFADLAARHAEPQRHYHGLTHLEALLRLLGALALHISPGSPSRLAIWWHDAIYDPLRRDNEEQSANLAREHLTQLGADSAVIDETCRIILATKDHFAKGEYGDGDYFLDADIAILGAPPSTYDAYAAGVRQEYSWAPDDLYRAGRSAFLDKAVALPRLFRTDAFEAAYAAQARENMARELASLQ